MTPLETAGWDVAVEQLAGSTVFHSRGWIRTLASTYGHHPLYHGLRGSNGSISSLLPLAEVRSPITGRRGVSLPFSDSCRPRGETQETIHLRRHAVEFGKGRGWRHSEFRGLPAELIEDKASLTFKSHALDLMPTEASLFDECDSGTRRSIKKGKTSPLSFAIENSPQAMRDYYRLHQMTRKRHGVFPQPSRFFDRLQSEVIGAGRGFVAIARKNEQPVAAAVFLHLGRNACYKFGASDERHKDLRANHLVMWQAIMHCRGLGCTTLDFGRSSAGNEGLKRLKSGFGSQESDLHSLRLDLKRLSVDRITDRSVDRMTAVIRRVPIWVARWIGAVLYPHMS